MPGRMVRPGRIPDRRVVQLFEDVMARWTTNHPLLAVGGFSYSRPSEEWLRALEGTSSFFVTSATVSEKGAAFTLHFRRNRDGVSSDEITLSWRDGAGEDGFSPAETETLLAMVASAGDALPPAETLSLS